ncbi:MAG: ATP-binding protein, partial [Cyanobacteriota bacterium SKYGB_h_bin112]|nr:ATP-binding protein [Cyanobacteriota bacterium SKYGB_h_bin112]
QWLQPLTGKPLSTLPPPDRPLAPKLFVPGLTASALSMSASPPQVILQALIALVDQVPLPMMVQTSTGQVLVRNAAWHQQLSELQNPLLIQQAAASLLEVEPAELAALRTARPEGQAPDNPMEANDYGQCQRGADANTCICLCPMRDGREKVWQFTKIPIQIAPPMQNSLHSVATSPSSLPFMPPFRLGTLGNEHEANPSCEASSVVSETVWLLLAQDRTEQHRVTTELAARNADLTQLNRLKDEFLACISHELKTPLTAILGLSSLLKEAVMGELNDRQLRYVQLIHQSGRHLVSIVNDMLDLTRMETGQLELVLEPVNIYTICDTAYHQAKAQHNTLESNLDRSQDASSQAASATPPDIESHFTLDIEPGLDYIVADALRLRQMLVHLLSNAIKFTEGQQPFGLTVSRWEGWIAFTVWDTGIGIPADKQHLIFQKFQQLESPLTRRFEGTGLGLVLTQRLARLHGGDVTFISKEGEGSEFTLLLPPAPPRSGYSPAPETEDGQYRYHQSELTSSQWFMSLPTPGRLSNRLVLLVESAANVIEDLTYHIMSLGYRVAIARSGTEALEKARRLQPCVIFLNPLLPLLSGWDVLTLLKSYADTKEIPVVVMGTLAERTRAFRNQADEFLVIPVQDEQLQYVLTSLASWVTEPSNPPAPSNIAQSLTVMVLNLTNNQQVISESQQEQPPAASKPDPSGSASLLEITQLLQTHHHRLLEVDDLEQADLLARVWKPDVVLLSDNSPDPRANVQQLSQYDYLASLPIVTLTPAVTEVANQISRLTIFPCLASPTTALSTVPGQPEVSTLLQVIQAAAGMDWVPCILLVDILHLTDLALCSRLGRQFVQSQPWSKFIPGVTTKFSGDWLRTLARYLQTAGLRGLIGQSWAEVLHHIHYQNVDVMLFYLHGADTLDCSDATIPLENALTELCKYDHLPPILVLDYCHGFESHQAGSLSSSSRSHRSPLPESLLEQLQSISTQVIPGTTSISQLLEIIHGILKQ